MSCIANSRLWEQFILTPCWIVVFSEGFAFLAIEAESHPGELQSCLLLLLDCYGRVVLSNIVIGVFEVDFYYEIALFEDRIVNLC